MSFSSELQERIGQRADYKCEVCGVNLRRKKKTDVALHVAHSASSFHAVGGPDWYLITDPPAGLERLKGKAFPGNFFLVSIYGLQDDGFCVCTNCHRDIHKIALKETKRQFPDHKGRNAHWLILERVTMDKVTGKI